MEVDFTVDDIEPFKQVLVTVALELNFKIQELTGTGETRLVGFNKVVDLVRKFKFTGPHVDDRGRRSYEGLSYYHSFFAGEAFGNPKVVLDLDAWEEGVWSQNVGVVLGVSLMAMKVKLPTFELDGELVQLFGR